MSKNRFTTQTRCDISKEPLYACILAGGVNYREKSKPHKILSLHQSETILDHQVKSILHAFPNAHISITVGFQADKVLKARPQIPAIESPLWETTNSVEELRLYLNTVFPKRLLIVDGAIYFNSLALQFIQSANVLSYENSDEKEVSFQSEDNVVEHFGFTHSQKWSGLVYLEGKGIECLRKHCKRENNKLCLFEGLNLLIENNVVLKSAASTKAEIVKL